MTEQSHKKKQQQPKPKGIKLDDAYCTVGWLIRTACEQVSAKPMNRELDSKLGAALAAAFPAQDIIDDDFLKSVGFHALAGAWHVLKEAPEWDQ